MPKLKEEDFPRGGVVKQSSAPKEKAAAKAREKDLFSIQEEPPKKGKKRKFKDKRNKEETKAKKKKTSIQTVTAVDDGVDSVTLKSLSPGMLTLGCIKEIGDYELVMSLPGSKQGVVPITNISDHYTQLLQEYSADAESAAEELKSLADLFHIGEALPCKVIGEKASGNKTKFTLSVNPKDVNSVIQHSALKQGMIVTGSVASVEDHGYTIELGIKSIKAFVKHKGAVQEIAQQKNGGDYLFVGQHLRCMIDGSNRMEFLAGENRSVHVCVDPVEMRQAQVTDVPFHSVVPGMLLTGPAVKISDDWLKVKLKGNKAVIPRNHLQKPISKYEQTEQVKACVLQVQPMSKFVVLTCLTHLLTPELAPRNRFGDLSRGEIIDEVTVIHAEKNHGVYFKLDDEHKGFASKNNLSDKEVKSVKGTFKYGQTHRARIMDFNYIDNVVVLSLRESILSKQYMSHADIKPGSLIKCEIRAFHDKGVSVNVTNQIKAFIPTMHLSEVNLQHPEKKFSVGDQLKCRVLTVDKSKIKLTHKKSLLSPKLQVVVSYEEAQPGTQLEGVIVQVKDNGVLVLFFNNVRGWVPKPQLSSERIDYPKKVFHVGQVVRCYVLHCIPEEERLILSFKIPGKKEFGTKIVETPEDYEVGKLVDCKVKTKTEEGLDVELLPSEMAAFLPRMHLSDSMELCDVLWDRHKVGDVIRDAMYFCISNTIIVTKKPCFIQAAYEGSLVSEFGQLKPGLHVPGVVKQIMKYGVFIDLSNKLAGLVPNKFLCDRRLPDPSKLYKVGQSVVAKVTEIDAERSRFLMSLRMLDCYHGDTEQGLHLVEEYILEHQRMVAGLGRKKGVRSKLAGMKPGDLAKVTITNVNDNGVLGTLPSGVSCLITTEHMTGVVCDVGDEVDGVVLFVDFRTPCVEISLDKNLHKDVKNHRDTKYTEARVGQLIKCQVQLIKDDFILVSLKGHAVGRMAYVPAKRHLNDVLEKHQFSVGQVNNSIIKRVHEDKVFVSLQVHEVKNDADGKDKGVHFQPHDLKVGLIKTAVVRSILDTQINITIKDVPGRIHITEILDEIEEGCTPLVNFRHGQEVKVKIIGFREVKSHRYLPISHPQIHKAMPECTIKPSKLSKTKHKKIDESSSKVYKKNDSVNFFVTKCENNMLRGLVSPLMKAEVSIFNLPDKVMKIGSLAEHFAVREGYMAKVINVKDGSLELTMSEHSASVDTGAVVRGLITSVSPSHGLHVQLPHGFRGHVALTDLCDCYHDNPVSEIEFNQLVTCYVIDCDEKKKTKCHLSLRQSRTKKSGTVTDAEVRHFSEIKLNQVLRGFIENCTDKGVFVCLGPGMSGYAQKSHMSDSFIKNPQEVFTAGKVVHVKVTGIDKKKSQISVSMKGSDTGHKENIPSELQKKQLQQKGTTKSKAQQTPKQDNKTKTVVKQNDEKVQLTDSPKQKTKKRQLESPKQTAKKIKLEIKREETDSGVEEAPGSDSDMEPVDASHNKETTTVPRLSLSAGFSWDDSFSLPAPSGGEDESDSDMDSDSEENKKPAKSKHEKKMEKKEAEARLMEREKQLLDQDYTPQSAEEFDRLVIQSPNSSMIWLRYMAFHLETTEIEKARSVAERALKTISFREEQEKLNVWVAYMNLENMYGTPDSLNEVFQRAVQNNEPIKVFQQLIKIYISSNKNQEAEKLYNTMVKRFKLHKDVWLSYGHFCFKNDQFDAGRNVMQRSLKSLPDKDHVDVISKFAQMEFKVGEPERGKTMFENIVSNYPKRSDLWSIYIDMVTKLNQIDNARQLYNRVIHLNMSAKKMKFFFKKFLEFEKSHGTPEAVQQVKQKAVDFVESCAQADS